MTEKTTRRNFLITSVAVAGGVMGANSLQKNNKSKSSQIKIPTSMPERVLGSTGIKVPLLGLGGAGTYTPLDKYNREKEAIAIIERALELGIKYFDTAASYGTNEDYLGQVLPPYRQQIFLATKTYNRDRDGMWRELENSLKRLNTDYLDLWQLHSISSSAHIETIFSKNGGIKAIEEAKEQKIIRFAGITGHHEPSFIIEAMRRYAFNTTLIPINAAEIHHPRSFLPVVLPLAQQKNIGVIAMKVPAYGKLFQAGGLTGIQQAMSYSLSQPGVSCCIIPADNVQQLEENVKVARDFKQLNDIQLAEIEKLTANIWQNSTFYRSWG
ncbi:aldo/keto reductase [Okeanomitos corallinicola TIOX110]|uniref:Aldo/keto reductase n=1 Tax=Okeanomitos corallinicola TIOX110 TaxID=3133117 RepID=A0ABZ2ULX4_9CYAN